MLSLPLLDGRRTSAGRSYSQKFAERTKLDRAGLFYAIKTIDGVVAEGQTDADRGPARVSFSGRQACGSWR